MTVRRTAPGTAALGTAALGTAAVGYDELAVLVAEQLGVPQVAIRTTEVTAHPYDQPAITIAGRFLVAGTAATAAGRTRRYDFFVEVIHAYERSPLRFAVPAPLRAGAAAVVPWRVEADLYRAELRRRLPPGRTTPRAFAVRDLDEGSAALWLERIRARPERCAGSCSARCRTGTGGSPTYRPSSRRAWTASPPVSRPRAVPRRRAGCSGATPS